MDGISTTRCLSKFKRRRVDVIHEFPRVHGRFQVLMDSRDGEHYIVDHVQPPQYPVTQATRRKYPPPRILMKGTYVKRDFPSGLGRQDLHSATKNCLPNAVSASKPEQKAVAETAVRKFPPLVTDFSTSQVCPAVKQNLFSVSHDNSANCCRKRNSFVSVTQENVSENSCVNHNLGSVSKEVFPRNGNSIVDYNNATSVADFRRMRSDVLGNKEAGGHQESSASCDEVKEVLRLFHQTIAKLSKENVAKPGMKKGQNVPRQAAVLLKDRQKWINTSKRVGLVPGVNIGDKFQFQAELNVIGLHCHFCNGIDYVKKNGISLATSIVVSHRYANYMASTNVLIYSGHGGIPTVRDRHKVKDQKLERGNLALKHSMDSKSPVRVIYKVKLNGSETSSLKGTGKSKKWNPIFVYDGLYMVEEFWEERGEFGKLVLKFKLKRNLDQPKLPQRWEKKIPFWR